MTGALAAAALRADVYENWTDVPGVLTADPRIVPEAEPIPALSFEELGQLSRVGTQVLHESAVEPDRAETHFQQPSEVFVGIERILFYQRE